LRVTSPLHDGGPVTTTIPGNGCTPPAAYANLFVTLSGHAQQETSDKLSKAWSSRFNPGGAGTIYNHGPASDESCVEDDYNGDVRNADLSYGTMIAGQLDHQTESDRLWTFSKKHMVEQSGSTTSEITWSVSPSGGCNGNTGGAPDGDEYFAAALVFAHYRWGGTRGKHDYGTEAQALLDLLQTKGFDARAHLVLFTAGANFVDGSNVLPAFYQTWAGFDADDAAFGSASVTAARRFHHRAADANGSSLTIPASTALRRGRWFRCHPLRREHRDGLERLHRGHLGDENLRHQVRRSREEHRRGGAGLLRSTLGFGLPASTGKPFVDKIWSASLPSHDYWNGVLHMLALLHVSGTFHLCCRPAATVSARPLTIRQEAPGRPHAAWPNAIRFRGRCPPSVRVGICAPSG
jgi:hypothetical protein